MPIHKLSAFHGQEKEKEICLTKVHTWLQNKMKPKTAEQIAGEIFNLDRPVEPSEFVLENCEAFPKNLGLPIWLANLLYTITHNNSAGITEINANYNESFYPNFIEACKVGVDYTMMFHRWEIMLLKEFMPEQEKGKQYVLDVITLHERVIAGNAPVKKQWKILASEIELLSNGIGDLTGVPDEIGLKELAAWENANAAIGNSEYSKLQAEAHDLHKIRMSYSRIVKEALSAAYLSINEYLNPDKSYTTSAEAIVNDAYQQTINEVGKMDIGAENNFRQKTWTALMNRLIIMLENSE